MVVSGGKVVSGMSRVVFIFRIDDEFMLFVLLRFVVEMLNCVLIMLSVLEGYIVVVIK